MYSFLQGGGEMGKRSRALKWDNTVLGSPESWPQSLRTAVSIVLTSSFPMLLWWGNELIQFYNDAFRPSLGSDGKHPLSFGQPAEGYWKENWHIIKPLIDKVMMNGESVYYENLPIPNFRNGRIEEVFWTFSYSPVLNEQGKPAAVLMTCFETTATVTAIKRIEESQQQLLALFEESPVAISTLSGDENFIILTANPFYAMLVGRKPEDLIGKPMMEALPEIKGQGFDVLLKEVLETAKPFNSTEVPAHLMRNGKMETIYVDLTYQPRLNADNNKVSGILIIATDVTQQVIARNKVEDLVRQRTAELAAANNSLLKMNSQLLQANANLEEFTYAASHDLKEPIRKLHFFSEHLKEQIANTADVSALKTLDRINNASKRMSSLIDDLLIFSQVSHHGTMQNEMVDLNIQINQALEDLELEVENKKAVLHIAVLPLVKGNGRQLQQMFQNLISNALKYSKPDVPPQIYIRSAHVQENNIAYTVISVCDNGIGFEQQYEDKIFQMFARLHGKHEYAGTGIGLSIVKKIIQNHEGLIRVKSTPDEGSTFDLLFPISTIDKSENINT